MNDEKSLKIVLTGGGTGGHFYPLIAVAEALREVEQRTGKSIEITYMADKPMDEPVLQEFGISFVQIPAGKRRLYFSIQNFFDLFKIAWSIPVATVKLFSIYPDVVFAKGGYVSYPVEWAARFLRIPVMIHESDSVPGRVNIWASKFARRVAVSYPEALEKMKTKEGAVTGQPIRKSVIENSSIDPYAHFGLSPDLPTVLVVGGSLGAQMINTAVLASLPKLLEHAQVIHQTGTQNDYIVGETAGAILESNPNKARYIHLPFLKAEELRAAASASSLVITRAGSMLFEIAAWGIPAIVIPIPETVSRDQRSNAYAYARSGAGIVIEEANLTDDIIASEVTRILSSSETKESMKGAAHKFASTNAARTIADELIYLAENHN